MHILRWIVLTLGVLGGALGLAATSNAAPLATSAAVAGNIGEGTVTEARWGRRGGYGRRGGFRRPSYRRGGYRRSFYGYRRPIYRPWGFRRRFYR